MKLVNSANQAITPNLTGVQSSVAGQVYLSGQETFSQLAGADSQEQSELDLQVSDPQCRPTSSIVVDAPASTLCQWLESRFTENEFAFRQVKPGKYEFTISRVCHDFDEEFQRAHGLEGPVIDSCTVLARVKKAQEDET